jgi:cupin 2 domain-containing protein
MNLFTLPPITHGESFETLLTHKNVKIVKIVSSEAIEENHYTQEEDEWVVIIEGEATLLLGDHTHHLTKGDSLLIPSHTPHSLLHAQQNTIWLCVHIE